MAVSHSFAGEHVEDGSDEEADADRNHHEIEHGVTLRGIERNRDPTDVGAAATNPEMARAFDLTRAFSRLGRVRFPDPSRGCQRIKCTPAH
jgi:hypothetical protein